MAGTLLHRFYVMKPKFFDPEFFHVMANPINYTLISWRAVDYMKIM